MGPKYTYQRQTRTIIFSARKKMVKSFINIQHSTLMQISQYSLHCLIFYCIVLCWPQQERNVPPKTMRACHSQLSHVQPIVEAQKILLSQCAWIVRYAVRSNTHTSSLHQICLSASLALHTTRNKYSAFAETVKISSFSIRFVDWASLWRPVWFHLHFGA